jgi:hypothetical protein
MIAEQTYQHSIKKDGFRRRHVQLSAKENGIGCFRHKKRDPLVLASQQLLRKSHEHWFSFSIT